jgi:hypothetical protein
VIVRPAQVVGAFFEKGLIGTILRDIKKRPGALPLLQHALYELWQARHGPWLTLKAYEVSGGVTGALKRRAQKSYEDLTTEQQELARNIFLRLTALGEGVSDTRRRVSRQELYPAGVDSSQVDTVLQKLSGPDARLIVTDDLTAEVTHEALIEQWDTLRDWLKEDRKALRVHRHLTRAAQEWYELGRDSGELYRGARLAVAMEWREQNESLMNELEREFLDTSEANKVDEEKKQLEAAQALASSEKKARLRLLYFTIGVTVLFFAAAVMGVYANWQAKLSRSRELASQAYNQLNIDPELSAALAREAVRVSHTVEAERALRDSVAAYQESRMRTLLAGHEGSVRHATFSFDGKRIVTASEDKAVRLWDAATGEMLLELNRDKGHDDYVYSAVFSYDDKLIVTASKDKTARVWDAQTGSFLFMLDEHKDAVRYEMQFGTRPLVLTANGSPRHVRTKECECGIRRPAKCYLKWIKITVTSRKCIVCNLVLMVGTSSPPVKIRYPGFGMQQMEKYYASFQSILVLYATQLSLQHITGLLLLLKTIKLAYGMSQKATYYLNWINTVIGCTLPNSVLMARS